MKVVTETKMIELVEETYIAEDGMKFSSKRDCEEYERNLRTEKAIGELNHITLEPIRDTDCFGYFDENDTLFVFQVRNHEDLNAINNWLEKRNGNTPHLLESAIGTTQFICEGYDGTLYIIGDEQDFKQMYIDEIDNVVKNLMKTIGGKKA